MDSPGPTSELLASAELAPAAGAAKISASTHAIMVRRKVTFMSLTSPLLDAHQSLYVSVK
jgi:hypothetical protein